MKIGLVTDCLADYELEGVLDICKKNNIESLEIGCGNWSSAPHLDLDLMLESKTAREKYVGLINEAGLNISSLNCSGNQLAPGELGKANHKVVCKTFKLASLLGIKNVVMMSGLPGGSRSAVHPNWIITSWPPETTTMLTWQWEQSAIPYWKDLISVAENYGITKIALEPHGFQLVYSCETFFRLRDSINSELIGFNLDPSHLFWMGANPHRIVRELGDLIYSVHIKDVRIEKEPAEKNTLLDGKSVHQFKERSWNFCIPGYGHDELWWKEFIILLKMYGYKGSLNIELEDYTLGTLDAIKKTVSLLERIMPL